MPTQSEKQMLIHHGGNPQSSARLAATLDYLRQYPPGACVSTLAIQQATGSMAPATDIADLRKCGVPATRARCRGVSENGRKVYEWFGVPGKTMRSAEIHIVQSGKPVCGTRQDKRSKFQWCGTLSGNLAHVTCKKCRNICGQEG